MKGEYLRRMALHMVAGMAAAVCVTGAYAQDGAPGEDKFPNFADVSKGYEKVVSTADDSPSFYTIWVDKKKGQMLAELPRGYEGQRHFIALTVASGETYAGLQGGDMLVYWKRFDKRLMLIEPNLDTKSTGDQESKSSVKRLFTDRVILDVPIVCTGPSGQPVIDMDQLLAGRCATFFGKGGNASLASIKTAKAFPENVELAFEMPTGGGTLQSFHYSISLLRDNPAFRPREADERVGYFTTTYRDLGKFSDKEKWVRYINRWHLEKRDARLKVSPPKQPIVYYIENTVPVRYRRWVEQGITDWNKAFEKVGILNAIEVRQQDAETGAHMEKDPEDVRYNFIRWLSNDIGTAIGPSRVNPNTGEILDADVVLTDGWIRHFWVNFNEILPQIAMEGMAPETLAWLDSRPQWDPRVRLAPPEQRDFLTAQHARRGVMAYGGHPLFAATQQNSHMVGSGEFDGLVNRTSQVSGLCFAAGGKAFDVAAMRMYLDAMGLDADAAQTGTEANTAGGADLLDGIPDWFIGPLLSDLVAHEVGHTLGLRHNFKASCIYSMDKINSEEIRGKKAFTGSVMDYTPINMNIPVLQAMEEAKKEADKKEADKKDGEKAGGDKKDETKKDAKPEIKPQSGGDYTMIDIGPYDFWAIEYGYTSGDPKDVVKRVAEPELLYGTDEDTGGSDPRARRYDFAADPLDYAKNQVEMAKWHRARLLDKFVKDGESWAKARKGYEMTLAMQTRATSIMANWVGGALVNRDRKGDPNARPPITPVPAAQQRAALKFVIDQSFRDEAFGLTPELLVKMTTDKWVDAGGMAEAMQESAWPVHDRIAGIQAVSLTQILNPTTLRRVYDNEFRVPSDQDALTLPEVFDTVFAAVWTELDGGGSGSTARKPMVSSLRRNLQREHLERLLDLSLEGLGRGAASKPISNLATLQLRTLKGKLDKFKDASIDAYTKAHFEEARTRIEKALDAQYIYNMPSLGGGGFGGGMFFKQPQGPQQMTPGTPEVLEQP